MLDELHVANIALIEDASIVMSDGLTVLTGETGAGKTALLAALKLICGSRADNSFIRDGASEAEAEARIIDADEHVVRRRLASNGRSSATIDGAMATVGELSDIASSIEIHGQHEQVKLLEPSKQLSYLDSWSKDAAVLEGYRSARREWLSAKQDLEQILASKDKNAQELEFMRFTRDQIEKVDPRPGELEELEQELPRLKNADRLAQALKSAIHALNDDDAALDKIASSLSELQRLVGIDPELDGLHERLSSSMSDLEDITRDLNSYASSIDTDPAMLDKTLGRMDELNGLMKRFGPGMEHVFQQLEAARAAIASASSDPEDIDRAERRLADAETAYRDSARALSDARHDAASSFCERLSASTEELAMEGSDFEFSFTPLEFDRWTDSGSEQIELMYKPAKTSKARPLRRIASGGELSRILLAIECIHYGRSDPGDVRHTIVFDEIDSGIGGMTGNAIAKRLRALSRDVQVIVVTHLAQVAALADVHYVVSKKTVKDGLPCTEVKPVEGEERVEEIARMLSGGKDEASLSHAESLLEGAE